MEQAGANRPELEKALKHYAKNPADSLKLRAAEFLVENMPDKYSVEYTVPFENLMAFCIRMNGAESRQAVDEAYGSMKPVIKKDVEHVTGDYLVKNIDLSFKVWEEQPWGKDVPFDVFCEDILPYRVANEPLENWREKVLACYAKLNTSFKTQQGITAVEACSQANSQLPIIGLTTDVPDMNYSMIMTSTRGMCDEMAIIAIFVMRALGIPVSKDYILKWPGNYAGHSWNSVYDGFGRRFSFMGTEKNPKQEHVYSHLLKSKVYRQTFAKQPHINADNSDIPPELHDRYMKDVTHEYLTPDTLRNRGCRNVEIPAKDPPTKNTGYAYLATKGLEAWNIIGWGETDTGAHTINFGAAGRNIMYLPLYYANSVQTPAHYPFIVDSNDSIRIFEPDTGSYRQITVTEISPMTYNYMERMSNGVFEGANRADFSDAEVLYAIKKLDGTYFYSANVRNPKPFRYVRYVSCGNAYGNVAEVELYSDRGEKLGGKPFGSPSDSPDYSCDKAFDGDVLTFFDTSPESDGWTGMDLGKPQTITKIRYFPRNEGNFIYEGHTYDLFYWGYKGWQLYEQQVAAGHFLNFRIPAGGLFYLKDATTDKATPWFTVDENGEWKKVF